MNQELPNKVNPRIEYTSPRYYQLREVSEEFHPHAISEAEQHIDRFITSLITYSLTAASQKGDELVLRNHVIDSVTNMGKQKSQRRWIHKIGFLLSSTIFGIVLPNFFTELSNLTNQTAGLAPSETKFLVIIYFLIALVTSSCSIWFMVKEDSI